MRLSGSPTCCYVSNNSFQTTGTQPLQPEVLGKAGRDVDMARSVLLKSPKLSFDPLKTGLQASGLYGTLLDMRMSKTSHRCPPALVSREAIATLSKLDLWSGFFSVLQMIACLSVIAGAIPGVENLIRRLCLFKPGTQVLKSLVPLGNVALQRFHFSDQGLIGAFGSCQFFLELEELC